MKPLKTPVASETCASAVPRPKSADLRCSDPNIANYYEYNEIDESSRSRGYQKPKQMWIAKDQAQTVCDPSSSPVYTEPEIKSDCALNLSHRNSICNPVAYNSPQSRNEYSATSPSTISAPGTAALLSSSSTNTSTLNNHTPLVTGHGSCIGDSISSCTSPVSVEPAANLPKQAGKRRPYRARKTLKNASEPTRTRRPYRTKKSKMLEAQEPITLTLNLSSAKNYNRISDDSDSEKRSNVSSCPSYSNKHSNSSGGGGLKIRLRRDLEAPPSKKGRSKSSASSFRIVESWCDADAPGSQQSRGPNSLSPSSSVTCLAGGFRVGDIVWAKLAGYPYWPSRISAIWARTTQQLLQATPLDSSDPSSLAVLATPMEASQGGGYTAKLDWLAWGECSYLSCAKLYPFLEYYDKFYTPRTRIKGYAEAIRIANKYLNEQSAANEEQKDIFSLDDSVKVSDCPNHSKFDDAAEEKPFILENPDVLDLSLQSSISDTKLSLNKSAPEHIFVPETDCPPLPDLGNLSALPQLDISGFGDFATHIPTFSEDEEEDDTVASTLKIALSSPFI